MPREQGIKPSIDRWYWVGFKTADGRRNCHSAAGHDRKSILTRAALGWSASSGRRSLRPVDASRRRREARWNSSSPLPVSPSELSRRIAAPPED